MRAMMRPYTKPDMERPIEELRAEIKRDYEALSAMIELPEELGFAAAVEATRAGMTPRDSYPFKKFQQAFADTAARHSGNGEAFADAFEIVTSVWNYFPHDDIGMSPVERLRAEVAAGQPPIDYDALREELTSPERGERMLKAIDERLGFLSEVAQAHLERHLRAIGGTKKDLRAIVDLLADPQGDPVDALQYLILTTIECARKRKKRAGKKGITMEDIQPAVRALTMCENHIASVMDNGHKNSRLFQNVARQCVTHMTEEMAKQEEEGKVAGSIRLIEPVEALDMLLDTHASVAELAKRLRTPEGFEEASHHILDWLALTDIRDILGREPKESAVLIMAAARLIAATGNPKRPFSDLAPKLRAAAPGFANDDAYEKEVTRLARVALANCGDPTHMMPIPGTEPDDCEERLTELAPELKLRSPLSPNDLPTPSPFM